MEKMGWKESWELILSNILLKAESTSKLDEASQDLYDQTELTH